MHYKFLYIIFVTGLRKKQRLNA